MRHTDLVEEEAREAVRQDFLRLRERLVPALQAAGVTVLHAVPTLLALFAQDVPSLRLINLGGEMWFFKKRLAPRAGYSMLFNRQLSRATLGISFRMAPPLSSRPTVSSGVTDQRHSHAVINAVIVVR